MERLWILCFIYVLHCSNKIHAVSEEDFQTLKETLVSMNKEISQLSLKVSTQQHLLVEQREAILTLEQSGAQQEATITMLKQQLSKQEQRLSKLEMTCATYGQPSFSQAIENTTGLKSNSAVWPNTNPQLPSFLEPQHIKKKVLSTANSQLPNSKTLPNKTDDNTQRHLELGKDGLSNQSGLTAQGQKRLVSEEVVAFMAAKQATQTTTGIGQHIHFEKVLLNSGGGYHERQGLFIAPQGGIYLFSAVLLASHTTDEIEAHAAIVHNGNALARLYAHGDSGRHDQGGQTIVASVEAGDEVWVENIDQVADIYGDSYTTFSGYLLWPM